MGTRQPGKSGSGMPPQLEWGPKPAGGVLFPVGVPAVKHGSLGYPFGPPKNSFNWVAWVKCVKPGPSLGHVCVRLNLGYGPRQMHGGPISASKSCQLDSNLTDFKESEPDLSRLDCGFEKLILLLTPSFGVKTAMVRLS